MYQYVTIFMSSAEKAKEWLQDHCNRVTVSIDKDMYIIDFDGSPAIYSDFVDHMNFIR